MGQENIPTFDIDEYERSTQFGKDIEAFEKSGMFDKFDREGKK